MVNPYINGHIRKCGEITERKKKELENLEELG
jgi:hypothetical protein